MLWQGLFVGPQKVAAFIDFAKCAAKQGQFDSGRQSPGIGEWVVTESAFSIGADSLVTGVVGGNKGLGRRGLHQGRDERGQEQGKPGGDAWF